MKRSTNADYGNSDKNNTNGDRQNMNWTTKPNKTRQSPNIRASTSTWLVARRNKDKEISLKRFFIIFLTRTILSLAFTGLLWAFLLTAASCSGIIIPANAVEHSLSAWISTLDRNRAVTPEEIPEGADYAFFDADGRLLRTSFDEKTLATAAGLAADGRQGITKRSGTLIYFCFHTDTQRIVVAYRLVARFATPMLGRLFPSAELFFFLLLFLMLAADLGLTAIRYARKLNGELQKLAAAAEEIRKQNLDFNPQNTRLREFNQIMDSLDRLKTDLDRSLREQWAMEQQKKRQLAALAHDIKTPLSIVTGNAELLLESSQTEEQREYTSFILEHARQIHRHVTEMLELFRSGQLSGGSNGICRLLELLSAAAQNVESLGKKKHLSCTLTTEQLPDILPVPKDALQRILDNLIDNAVEYSPKNGTVFLHASAAEHMLQLSIRDEGEGFSKEALSLAVSEFYRADPSRSSRTHFGLGLAIAKQIAAELNGSLRLANAPEGGALVTVCIPLASLQKQTSP